MNTATHDVQKKIQIQESKNKLKNAVKSTLLWIICRVILILMWKQMSVLCASVTDLNFKIFL
jgi:hypothetical protein